jgi:hypothetical protein
MLEIVIASAVIAAMASFFVIAASPLHSIKRVQDAKRHRVAREIQRAMEQYEIFLGNYPNNTVIDAMGLGSAYAKPICKTTVTGSSCSTISGIDLSDTIPNYVVGIDTDPSEPTASNFTGYQMYRNRNGYGVTVESCHLGYAPSDQAYRCNSGGAASSAASSACTVWSSAASLSCAERAARLNAPSCVQLRCSTDADCNVFVEACGSFQTCGMAINDVSLAAYTAEEIAFEAACPGLAVCATCGVRTVSCDAGMCTIH